MELIAFILAITAGTITDAQAQMVLSNYIQAHPEAVIAVDVATVEETVEYLDDDSGSWEWNNPEYRHSVSGANPVISAKDGHRYICGEVATISITPPSSGICDVVFTSGTTAAILTVPNTVKWPEWFDPTSLETNCTYEINIMDGMGAVGIWTL